MAENPRLDLLFILELMSVWKIYFFLCAEATFNPSYATVGRDTVTNSEDDLANASFGYQ